MEAVPTVPPPPYYLERTTLQTTTPCMENALAAFRALGWAHRSLGQQANKAKLLLFCEYVAFEVKVRQFADEGTDGFLLECQCMHSRGRVVFLSLFAKVGERLAECGLLRGVTPSAAAAAKSTKRLELLLPPSLSGCAPPTLEDLQPLLDMATSTTCYFSRREALRCLAQFLQEEAPEETLGALATDGRAAAACRLALARTASDDFEVAMNAALCLGRLG